MTFDIDGGDEGFSVQVPAVGVEFHPGMDANAEIAGLLLGREYRGYNRAAWTFNIATQEWERAPNYCSKGGMAETWLALEELGVTAILKHGDEGYIVLLQWHAHAAITVPFSTESHALAAALHHVLITKSCVT